MGLFRNLLNRLINDRSGPHRMFELLGYWRLLSLLVRIMRAGGPSRFLSNLEAFSSYAGLIFYLSDDVALQPFLTGTHFSGVRGRLTITLFGAMKKAILKVRSTARGSVGEVGIHCSLPCQKLVLKQRPLARGTVGLLGVRRAMLGGEPTTPMIENHKPQKTIAIGSAAVVTVTCAPKKIAAKKRPRKTPPKKLQVGEIAVSLTEDESEEIPKEVSGVKCGGLGTR